MSPTDTEEMIYEDVIAQLGQIANLNCEWLEALHLGQQLSYTKNTTIPHMSPGGFYFLAKGEVVISYCSPEGLERLTLFIKPNCIFNEARSVSTFKPACQFRCVTDVEVYRFPSALLENHTFIEQHSKLIANLISSMGIKMLIHYAYLSEMGVGTPTALLARFILGLMHKYDGKRTFELNMTQQNVADLLGVHRTTLARAIQQLQRKGVITQFTGRRVDVQDEHMLKLIAES